MHQPMNGVRVLEVAQFWFVPSAGAVLADWGADVIKVEHPERGDGHGIRRRLSKPAADLSDPEWRRRAEPEAVYRAIHDGVPRTPMAAWRIFEEDDIWALTAHILRLAEEP